MKVNAGVYPIEFVKRVLFVWGNYLICAKTIRANGLLGNWTNSKWLRGLFRPGGFVSGRPEAQS
jgi:hypothetical protein